MAKRVVGNRMKTRAISDVISLDRLLFGIAASSWRREAGVARLPPPAFD
jgi:hypothetical protein